MPPPLAPRCAQTTVRPDAHAPNEMLVVMGLVGHECAPMAMALARRLAMVLSTSRVGGSAARSTGPGRSLAQVQAARPAARPRWPSTVRGATNSSGRWLDGLTGEVRLDPVCEAYCRRSYALECARRGGFSRALDGAIDRYGSELQLSANAPPGRRVKEGRVRGRHDRMRLQPNLAVLSFVYAADLATEWAGVLNGWSPSSFGYVRRDTRRDPR